MVSSFEAPKILKEAPKTLRPPRNSAAGRVSGRLRALLAGAGGVGLQRPDALGERSTALGQDGCGGAMGGGVVGRARCRPRRLARPWTPQRPRRGGLGSAA